MPFPISLLKAYRCLRYARMDYSDSIPRRTQKGVKLFLSEEHEWAPFLSAYEAPADDEKKLVWSQAYSRDRPWIVCAMSYEELLDAFSAIWVGLGFFVWEESAAES